MRCGLTDEIEIGQERGSALVQSFPRAAGKEASLPKATSSVKSAVKLSIDSYRKPRGEEAQKA